MLDNHDGNQDRHENEDNNENDIDESGLKDDGNYEGEDDGLFDIKNTIENALS